MAESSETYCISLLLIWLPAEQTSVCCSFGFIYLNQMEDVSVDSFKIERLERKKKKMRRKMSVSPRKSPCRFDAWVGAVTRCWSTDLGCMPALVHCQHHPLYKPALLHKGRDREDSVKRVVERCAIAEGW